jgi:hypothetical protein
MLAMATLGFALDSYALLLVGGFFLGIAGTTFAVGVPQPRRHPARQPSAAPRVGTGALRVPGVRRWT